MRCYTLPLKECLALINPVFCPTSSTYQKHFKLGQCLEIDDKRSLAGFDDVTLARSLFTDCSAFYRPAFYRLKRVNILAKSSNFFPLWNQNLPISSLSFHASTIEIFVTYFKWREAPKIFHFFTKNWAKQSLRWREAPKISIFYTKWKK